MIGLVLALLAGFCVSVSMVYLHRGVHRSGEVSSSIPIFAFAGLVFFAIPVFISGEFAQLTSVTWLGFGSLAGAGLVHFIFGRILAFTSIRLIGANRAVPIFSIQVPIAVILGILFLRDP